MSLFTQSMRVTGSAMSTASPWIALDGERDAVVNVTRGTANIKYNVCYSLANPMNGTVTRYVHSTVSTGDTSLVHSKTIEAPVGGVCVLVVYCSGSAVETLSIEGMQ